MVIQQPTTDLLHIDKRHACVYLTHSCTGHQHELPTTEPTAGSSTPEVAAASKSVPRTAVAGASSNCLFTIHEKPGISSGGIGYMQASTQLVVPRISAEHTNSTRGIGYIQASTQLVVPQISAEHTNSTRDENCLNSMRSSVVESDTCKQPFSPSAKRISANHTNPT